MENMVSSAPRNLRAVVELVNALTDLGDTERAFAIATDAIEKVEGRRARDTYNDLSEYETWIYRAQADALESMGKWREAERAAKISAKRPGRGNNVINLALFYNRLDRPNDALRTIGTLSGTNSFGRMMVYLARLGAAVSKNNKDAERESLSYLRAHQADALWCFQEALVVSGRLEEAAKLLISRLSDPRLRGDALEAVQLYSDSPMTDRRRLWQQRWQLVVARADVQMAIFAVGRMERFSLPEN
jgi:tetratricopeptide (TPR) repeat protein